ncbi:hypothetical protein [Nonomuraea sp. NPDC048826]|uniref:hypothetical protein n=1 Tax=Nonomuraea sp. NPDC048826 TaxID=3364347 RepID=UPI0037150960
MRLGMVTACAALVAGALAAVSPASAATTRYEAETAPAACTGAVESNWSGHTGSGSCDGDNTTGAHARFTVDAPAGGTGAWSKRAAPPQTRPPSLRRER